MENNHGKLKKIVITIYLVLSISLFLLTTTLDIFETIPSGNTIGICNIVKIVLALLFVIALAIIESPERQHVVFIIAYVFILIADIFLSFPNNKEWGVLFFIFAQFFIFEYMCFYMTKASFAASFLARIVLSGVAAIIVVLNCEQNTLLLVLVALYAINLLSNTAIAFGRVQENLFLALGLLFFVLCDIYIGLSVGNQIGVIQIVPGSMTHQLFELGFDFSWFFYSICHILLPFAIIEKNAP